MVFAERLGIIVSTVILSIAWTCLMFPFAMAARIFSVRLMDLSFDRARETYWEDRKESQNDFKLLERQF